MPRPSGAALLCARAPEPPRLPWPMAALSLIGLSLMMWIGAIVVAQSVIALFYGWS